MGRLVQAEWTKLLTTRVWIGLLIGGCVLAGGFAALFTGLAGQAGGPPAVGTEEFDRLVLSLASNGSTLSVVLGIIGMTQEYRHRTATPTFLTTPRRGRVVTAKLIAYLVAGIPFAVVVTAVDVVVVLVYAGARGSAPSLGGENARVILGALAAIVLYTVIGVGVGALFRNQVGAIVGTLVYLFVIQNIVAGITAISGVYKWLPGGAESALTLSSSSQGPDLLSQWQGGLLLLGYALVAAVLGTVFAVRRDIS